MAKRWLAASIFVGGFSVFIALYFGKYHGGRIEFLSIYSLMSFYFGIACLLLSFISLYNSKNLTRSVLLWIFGPILGLIVLHGIAALVWGSPRVYSLEEYLALAASSPTLILRAVILVADVAGTLVVVAKYFRARKVYGNMLDNYFSDEQKRRTRWIDHYFIFLLIMLVFVAPSSLMVSLYFDLLYGVLLTLGMVYLIVKFINYQSAFLCMVPAIEYAVETAAAPKEYPDSVVGVLLQQWMHRDDKPFLRSALSLSDVSHMTGVGRRKLSAHINIKYGMTFNSWINMLRIQEIERILKDPQYNVKTLSEIAYGTGFADLAAMSNAFKKINGVSPSAFRKLQKI